MARPLEHDKRLDLARRAVKVLAYEGLDISNQRLAEALEMKRPTLLYHFPTRGHIVETALEELLVEQARFVMEAVEAESHPIDRLCAQVRAVHTFHHGREARVVFLSQAIAALGGKRMEEIVEIGNRVFAAQREAAAARVRAGIDEGSVVPCDADALVSLIRAVVDGLMVQRVMTGLELEPVHTFLWDRVLRPLKVEPTR